MSELNLYYLDLMGYALALCCFMPLWVFLVLGCQLFHGGGVMIMGKEKKILEFFWTLLPTIAVSLLCYYKLYGFFVPLSSADWRSVLVTGNQWYWNYFMSGSEKGYDSVMLDFLNSVDKPLRLEVGKVYVLLVSSGDVMHSFSLPAFNMKLDGIPGRVNKLVFSPSRLGVFVGYCSELCGAGHSYMPIVLEVVKTSR